MADDHVDEQNTDTPPAEPELSPKEYLARRFPEMRPISSAPTLSTVNGIGMSLTGKRDHDFETNSYVTTHVFCLIFIPVTAVGAYRVIDSPNGGWYFLGKVPLSRLAKNWNRTLLAAIVALVGIGLWHNHTHSPDYIAARHIEEADELAAKGQAAKAAEFYQQEMMKSTAHAGEAQAKLRGLVEQPPASLKETAGVYRIALALQRQNRNLVPDLFDRGMKLAEAHVADDPEGALNLVETIAPLAHKPQPVLDLKRKLLESLVASRPNDAELASGLAVIYENQGETAKCEALLLPHQQRLGELEGAAILGRLFATKGKFQESYVLLQPYVRARLPRLRAAEQQYEASLKRAQDQAIAELKSGNAFGFSFDQYQRAGKQQQDEMVQQYLTKRIMDDAGIKTAQKSMSEQSNVVGVALELGMVMLQAAQQRTDPADRKQGLEETEKLFLEIRSFAGEADAYRINLGQVYYWLGKHADGKKEFDELLKAKKREGTMLVAVSRILREVGETSEARKLVEEAYEKEADPAKKKQAAVFRSLLFKDIDDEILWLGRSDVTSPEIKASLCGARGNKALQDGKDELAAAEFRNAIDAYSQLPENASTLNNSALVVFSLYHLTNDKDLLVRGMDKIDRAVALQPSDSILLHNAASIIFDEAVRDVIGNRLDFKLLKRQGARLDLLPFVYADAAGKQKIVEQLVKHPGTIKARGYCDKLLILAPKRDDAYTILSRFYFFTRDAQGLRSIAQRLEKVELDQKQERQETLDFLRGKDEPNKINQLQKSLEKHEATLVEARKARGPTLAVAANAVALTKIGNDLYKKPVDPDELVKLAEEAHEASPSDGTRSLLCTALTFRAHKTLAKELRPYADMAKTTNRSLASSLINYILGQEGPLRDKALANPDVKRAIAIRIEQIKAIPDERSPTLWAMINAADAKEGQMTAEFIRKDVAGELERSIQRTLSPLSAGQALSDYWALRIAGKHAEASKVLQQVAAQGVPLPPLSNK